jgi:hypothetical protein
LRQPTQLGFEAWAINAFKPALMRLARLMYDDLIWMFSASIGIFCKPLIYRASSWSE